MLVEINLLPQKNSKSKLIFVMIGIIIFLFVATSAFFVWQINAKEAKLSETQNQLDTKLAMIEQKNQQLKEYNASTSVQELEQAIKWADTQSFDSVFLLDQLTKMLPERGFILDFKIDENYKINQVIQFDTRSDAAYYLHTLLAHDWVEEAVISEAKSDELDLGADTEEGKTASVSYYNESNVLPRYIAQYEIILNLQALEKAAGQTDEKKGEN
ncbi:PilN domain-containing protein [Bacillus benzoevorans]|uniref:Type IV pilus assembly protein PilN n=1 Tax=Bacillus benzoevorans TaxID=1456 RepID=A0A7X0HS64_9BACI|nr:fimbrial assembly protein [Bacillus benzoevorans]MBB6445869.1 type IV pilus assembly protein PilN [Bacillus benzoevorans]